MTPFIASNPLDSNFQALNLRVSKTDNYHIISSSSGSHDAKDRRKCVLDVAAAAAAQKQIAPIRLASKTGLCIIYIVYLYMCIASR